MVKKITTICYTGFIQHRNVTDRWTELLYQHRSSVCWRAIKTISWLLNIASTRVNSHHHRHYHHHFISNVLSWNRRYMSFNIYNGDALNSGPSVRPFGTSRCCIEIEMVWHNIIILSSACDSPIILVFPLLKIRRRWVQWGK